MKTNKMPIVLILLAASWLIAPFGVFAALFLYFTRGLGQWPLIAGSLLLGLILSAFMRVFANIVQIVFDIKQEVQRVREVNNVSAQHLWSLNQVLKNEFQANVNNLNESLKAEIQNQTWEIDKIIQGLNQVLKNEFQANINNLNESLKNELRSQATGRDDNIKSLNQNLKAEIQNQTAELDKYIKALNQSFSGGISGLNGDLVLQLKLLTSHLQALSNNCEQINCDSKDLNQNINQIRNFFEKIERHLDLKQ